MSGRDRDRAVVHSGISTLAALGLVFVAARLFGAIGWPWWQVLLPFYIVPAIIAVLIVAALTMVLVMVGIEIVADAAIRRMER